MGFRFWILTAFALAYPTVAFPSDVFEAELFEFGFSSPASLQLREGALTFIEDVRVTYEIQSSVPNNCRGRRIYGRAKNEGEWKFKRIELTECHGKWSVVLEATDEIRYFRGKPVKVFDKEACLEKLALTVCYDRYLPATCEAATTNGRLRAEGTNTCYARLKVRRLGCENGINPEELTNEDIHCVIN